MTLLRVSLAQSEERKNRQYDHNRANDVEDVSHCRCSLDKMQGKNKMLAALFLSC
jgi:hypothetical protein